MRRRDKAGKTARRRFKASKRKNGLKTRNRDETLEQLAATSEVLVAISRSTFDLQTVLAALVKSAGRLCQAENVQIFLYDGEFYRLAADNDFSPEYEQYARDHPIRPGRDTLVARTALGIAPVQIRDALADPEYAYGGQKLGGYRTLLGVPLLRDKKCIGVIALTRSKVRPFTDRQIALVTNFAAQAVIAIENTRLFNELRQRTDDLSESLEQQTATSEVLKVISSSPGDLESVFQAILANATRICDAKFGVLFRHENNMFRAAATLNAPQAFVEFHRKRGSFKPPIGTPLDRLLKAGGAIYSADEASNPSAPARFGGARSLVTVPMRKDGQLIGAIIIYRQEVRPFTDKQIELLTNFAAQAGIAIENTRLLSELRHRTADLGEALARQTATSEVLGVISRSKFDLLPILQSVVDTAARLCRAERAVIFRLDRGIYHFAAGYSLDPAYLEIERQTPITPGQETVVGRAAVTRKVAQIDDAWTDSLYGKKEDAKIGGVRSMIGVPLMRQDEPIGVIALARSRVEPFGDREIELVTTFADQAVIAIENVRLFEAEQQRTKELRKSLEDLRTAQDRLVQTQKLASLGQLTAGIAHEIKNPLNFVNNFSGVSVELISELQGALRDAVLTEKARAEVNELSDTLRENLDKIVQHGKRADSIVKNMLLHSREGSGEHRLVDINSLVEESLNLAYHGARAEKEGFNTTLKRSFDPAAGQADVFPQDITRVLLNLISNGFYAATKRKAEAGDGYEPTLVASTRNLGDRVEIRVRDNGGGIPAEVKQKIFNPFFTTKPAGEGTGLGLSISHDVVVKQHGGSIDVETKPGSFSEFIIVLPRARAPLVKSGESS